MNVSSIRTPETRHKTKFQFQIFVIEKYILFLEGYKVTTHAQQTKIIVRQRLINLMSFITARKQSLGQGNILLFCPRGGLGRGEGGGWLTSIHHRGVCIWRVRIQGGCASGGGGWTDPPPELENTRYASYWNAFLLAVRSITFQTSLFRSIRLRTGVRRKSEQKRFG